MKTGKFITAIVLFIVSTIAILYGLWEFELYSQDNPFATPLANPLRGNDYGVIILPTFTPNATATSFDDIPPWEMTPTPFVTEPAPWEETETAEEICVINVREGFIQGLEYLEVGYNTEYDRMDELCFQTGFFLAIDYGE